VALAQAALADLARRSRVPVLCGGTGLYFRALMEGLAEVPPVPDAVKREVQAFAERAGVAACQAELRRVDPALAAQVHPHHASRILRALEVFRATGRPLSEYQRDTPFRAMSENVLYVGIAWERRALWTRIEARVHEMLAAGWVDEVRGLLARGYAPTLKPLRGIGYKEIVAHLQGTRDAASLAPDIAIHTRQYAKRQMTWFRRDVHIAWCSPGDTARLLRRVERHLTHA
jgi:tRNA dimethylallyltransferase